LASAPWPVLSRLGPGAAGGKLDRAMRRPLRKYVGSLFGAAWKHAPSRRGRRRDQASPCRIAGSAGAQCRRPCGKLLTQYFRLPVRVEEFVARWLELPLSDRSRLGERAASAQLGRARPGALGLGRPEQHPTPYPGPHLGRLCRLPAGWSVRARGCGAAADLSGLGAPVGPAARARRREVPPTELGRRGRLGWSSWLGGRPRPTDANDLVLDYEGRADTPSPPHDVLCLFTRRSWRCVSLLAGRDVGGSVVGSNTAKHWPPERETMRALNADAFDDPLERVLHERKAADGMWAIQKIHLRSGQFYYRFVNADTTPAPRWCEGRGGWITKNYRRIVTLAERGEQSVAMQRVCCSRCPTVFGPANPTRSTVSCGLARAAARRPRWPRTHDRRSGRSLEGDEVASAGRRDAVICAEARPDGRTSACPVAFPIVECRRIASGFFA